MKGESAKTAAIDDVRYKVAITIVSAAKEHGFKLPYSIEIIDFEGEVGSYDISEDYRITPHQEFEKVLTFPFSVVLSDGGPRGLAILITRPKNVQ